MMVNVCKSCGHIIVDQGMVEELKLSGIQKKIFDIVSKHSHISANGLACLVYGDRDDGGPLTAAATLKVHVWRLNQKLQKYGLRIFAGQGKSYGWSLIQSKVE